MKRTAVFFDRDNTLIASDGYLGDPAKVQLIPGAADAVARARRLGHAVVVFSNQSGVARGMFSEEDVQAVNARMEQMLAAENAQAVIDRHEYCPFHPEGTVDVYARESDRRKPRPGMIHSAAKALELDLERSWVIGDAGRDVEAGRAAGCRTILFVDPSLKKSPAAEGRSAMEPDFTVASLTGALDVIEHGRVMEPVAVAAAVSAREEMPAPGPSVAPIGSAAAAVAPQSTPADAGSPSANNGGPAKRVPKVVIGSKYVPPEGKEAGAARGSTFVPPAREDVAERAEVTPSPMARKMAAKAADEDRPAAPPPTMSERMESLLEQIFLELRRQHEQHEADFSVSKLLAGVVQVLALAVVVLAYFRRESSAAYMQLALFLQTLTISLLIMSRQR
jgi:D-glycero-D-manno-heptose 1,7-bisphosphate phosphatase